MQTRAKQIGIIGAGLIGHKRGKAVFPYQIKCVFDVDIEKSKKLAQDLHAEFAPTIDSFFHQKPDLVIIATPHVFLSQYVHLCLDRSIPVLVEKPAGIHVNEIQKLIEKSNKMKTPVKVGFNHRFHPGIMEAHQIISENAIGPLFMIRARYGHGARIGYEKEWRCDPQIAGGGELMDQGVHLLDLIYWFMKGDVFYDNSSVHTLFWQSKVEDNAVVNLKGHQKFATFHVSFSEWKNIFSLELYGTTGKIIVEGLGKSYGPQTLTLYQMPPEMGPPTQKVFTYDLSEDLSWQKDLKNLTDHLENGTPLLGDLHSALYALENIQKAYQDHGLDHLPCSV